MHYNAIASMFRIKIFRTKAAPGIVITEIFARGGLNRQDRK